MGLGGGIAQIIDKHCTTMRMYISMDKRTDVMVFGEKYPPSGGSFRQQGFIAWIDRSLGCINDIVTNSPHRANRQRHDIGIGEQAHAIGPRW